jgi:hypothetical protein
VKNAAQPIFGESRIMRTTDLGATWNRVGSPPADVSSVVPDPLVPQLLFASGDHLAPRLHLDQRMGVPFSG